MDVLLDFKDSIDILLDIQGRCDLIVWIRENNSIVSLFQKIFSPPKTNITYIKLIKICSIASGAPTFTNSLKDILCPSLFAMPSIIMPQGLAIGVKFPPKTAP